MPRVARKKSNSGIYHIIMRGINRQVIFEDEEDFKRFIQTLHRFKEVCEYTIFAYCLMENHLHVLLKEGKEPLETVMRRICGSYVFWYNRKYGRIGYLFQDRFWSEPVEDDEYFLTVVKYIFRNPVKAGIVSKPHNYPWSNYLDYIKEYNRTEVEFVLNLFNTDKEKAVRCFINHINNDDDDMCLEMHEKHERYQITDEDAKNIIKAHCKIENAIDLQKLNTVKRNEYIKDLRERHRLSIRQLERLTGISRGIIQRV